MRPGGGGKRRGGCGGDGPLSCAGPRGPEALWCGWGSGDREAEGKRLPRGHGGERGLRPLSHGSGVRG